MEIAVGALGLAERHLYVYADTIHCENFSTAC
jgi:hypothetical protein